MKTNSPSKFQSIVAIVVFTFSGFGTLAQAASPATPAAGAVQTQTVTVPQSYLPTAETECLKHSKDLGVAASKIKNISAKLGGRYASCLGERASDGRETFVEGLVGAANRGDDDEEEGENTSDSCENYKSACSVLDGVDTADLLKSAREDNNEAQQAFQKAQQDAKENQKKLQRTMSSIQLSMTQAEREYKLQLDAIQKELDAKNKAADQELRKAVAELRKNITSKRNALTEINDGVRQAENALASAKTTWEASCRTEAYQKYEAVKAEIKKQTEENKAKGKKLNYSNSNLAGASNRKEDKEKRRMQSDYANGYKECIAGISPAGAGAKNALETAKKALDAALASAEERRETLQSEIKDLMSDYADMQTSTAENKETLRQSTESKISAANIAYQNAVEKANKAYAEAQEDLSDAIQFGQAGTQIAAQNAQAAQMEYINAQNIQRCTGSSKLSKSAQDRLVKQIEGYEDAEIEKEAICNLRATCEGTPSKSSFDNACGSGSSRPSAAKPAVGSGSDRPAGQ